jgi:hypothetical protein
MPIRSTGVVSTTRQTRRRSNLEGTSRTAMKWLWRYCRARSQTEELVMMTLMQDAAISLIICEWYAYSALCYDLVKSQKNIAPSPNAPPSPRGLIQILNKRRPIRLGLCNIQCACKYCYFCCGCVLYRACLRWGS